MADSLTTTDYLGLESPLSLNEKPALPVGGAPAGASAGPSGSGGAAASGASAFSSPGSVTTTSSGTPGIPGIPGPPPRPSAPESSGVEQITKLLSGGGAVASTLKKLIDAIQADGGTASNSVLDPKNFKFSLDGDQVSLSSGGFSFDVGALDDILPDLLHLGGAFDEGGAGTALQQFSFSGPEGGGLNPGDFSFGVDTSFTAPTGAGSTGALDAVGDALPYAGAALSLGQGLMSGNVGSTIAGVAPAALSALAALATEGVSLGEALASAGGGPFMALWGIPQMADSIYTLINGGEHDSSEAMWRRAGRTKDERTMQTEIWKPLFEAQTSEDFVSALSTPVGGSTIGDALASVLKYNLSGTYYGDTGFHMLPDTHLGPLRKILTDLGYTGATEPQLNDVGGIGEIIAGGGPFLPPDMNLPGQMVNEEGTPIGNDRRAGSRQGAIAWDRALRALTEGLTGNRITADLPFDTRYGLGTPPAAVSGYDIGQAESPESRYTPSERAVSQSYLDELYAYDPAAASSVILAMQREGTAPGYEIQSPGTP